MNLEIEADLELSSASVADAEELYQVVDANRDRLSPWFTRVESSRAVSDSLAILASLVEGRERGEVCSIVIRGAGSVRGIVGLHPIDLQHRNAEHSYWLSREAEDRGLMTRCAHGLMRHGMGALVLNGIQLRAAAQNAHSRAVAIRLGFSQEGILREVERNPSGYVDLVLFSLLRLELWAATGSDA